MTTERLAIIGLGYVGLPLAVAFAKKFRVIGLDTDSHRVRELNDGIDSTLEVEDHELDSVLHNEFVEAGLVVTENESSLQKADIFIITVPTPIDKYHRPDLRSLKAASKTVSKYLKRNNIVIYESTVYPGATEEVCIPLLENGSGLKLNIDFFAGYSPERINPGDREHRLTNIRKVVSGSSPEATKRIHHLYERIIEAGTYIAPSIKVAEAAKVIENAQRDINIAFVNELSKIFRRLDLDTKEVLEASATKWNFLPFTPGLVGGHCIGVDPYYLAQKAMEVGYHPEIILAGRRLNDGMGNYIAGEVVKLMIKKDIAPADSRALVLGFTFKENCPDIRNTKVIDIVTQLESFSVHTDVYDPWVNVETIQSEYNIPALQELPESVQYNAVIIAVAHKQFTYNFVKKLCCDNCVLFDVKSVLEKQESDARL